MVDGAPEDAAASFDTSRTVLRRLAYRMLGSLADGEDVLQEAFIRWMGADRTAIREPEAFLRRIVTRLCLDHLKSAKVQRETYVGAWLPEPIVEDDAVDDVTLPLMLALERLSPLERAAFLLHDVFGLPFEEVAATIGREAPACRQIAARARVHVREARPRYKIDQQRERDFALAFFTASRGGDMDALSGMLAADVSVHADSGGKRAAATGPVIGHGAVLALHAKLATIFRTYGSTLVRTAFVNGLPGFVSREADGVLQTTALDIEDGEVVAIYVMRNPDKLRHLEQSIGV